jgi:hypothetical protein
MEDTVHEIAALARELAVETEHGRLPDALLEKLLLGADERRRAG